MHVSRPPITQPFHQLQPSILHIRLLILLDMCGAEIDDWNDAESGTYPPCLRVGFSRIRRARRSAGCRGCLRLESDKNSSDTSRMTLSQVVIPAAKDKIWVKEVRAALRDCGDAARMPESGNHGEPPYLSAAVKEGFGGACSPK